MNHTPQEITFSIAISELDPSLLPIDPALLRNEPQKGLDSLGGYFDNALGRDNGEVDVDLRGENITVRWRSRSRESKSALLDWAVKILQVGAYRMGMPVFASLLQAFPEEPIVLFNFGMLLSDHGRLEEAIGLLEKATTLEPKNENAWNALGVACQRKGDIAKAQEALTKSHEINPENPYTLRNLGSIVAKADPSAALQYLERAARLLPRDQATQYGYGLCLRDIGRTRDASGVFQKALALSPYSEIAELCRKEQSAIADQEMRSAPGGQLRMDVVMYCLGAMQRFEKMDPNQVRAITLEIALLGRTGLDINDPAKQHRLKSASGEFSGLQLLAYMYVGLGQIAPQLDPGVDFSKEFEAAKSLFRAEGNKDTGEEH